VKDVYEQTKRDFEGLIQNLRERAGFTLIELLVVVAIIGILSSVVLASLGGARESARDSRRQADLDSIQTAVELYANDKGDYPSAIYGSDFESGDYMSQVPTDPATDANYGYATSSNSFCLAAELAATSTPQNDVDCSAESGVDTNGGGGDELSIGDSDA
jgi:prepilin-type N-terminal cleavage/methylation domain-containing protein